MAKFSFKLNRHDEMSSSPPQAHPAGAAPVEQTSVQAPAEGVTSMESTDNNSPAYPFVTAEMDIEMIDKFHPVPSSSVSANGLSAAESNGKQSDPVAMAQQLGIAVQDMVQRLHEQEQRRYQLEQRLEAQEKTIRAHEALKQKLHESVTGTVSDDEMETLVRVVQSLIQDPNHIMVLASVAQNAQQLLTVVNNFNALQQTVRQTSTG